MSRKICVLIVLFGVLSGIILSDACGQSRKDIYSEVITTIQENAFFLEPGTPRNEIIRDTIRAYLKSIDPFSEYWTPEEYAAFQASQKSHYAGVGMDIEFNESGQIVCSPHRDSPAEKAGIQFGDILQAVDGEDVAEKSLLTVGTLVRGEEGTNVQLTILRGTQTRMIPVTRAALRADSVYIDRSGSIPVITITSFKSGTDRDLRIDLGLIRESSQLVLDLRGNPGGDLYKAIDAAMLFLDRDDPIVTVKSRKGLKQYKSTNPPLYTSLGKVFVWQDQRTASAAEVFIAALTQNNRAESIGKPSRGKGVMQEIFTLGDGSALVLTTASLQTPDGTSYHERGLNPTHVLEESSPQTDRYLAKVMELLGKRTVASRLPSVEIEGSQADTLPKSGERVPDDRVVEPTPAPHEKPVVQEHTFITYLTCFDEDFDTEKDAELWSLTIQQSFTTLPELYLLQRNTDAGVKFLVCLGTFQQLEEAQKEQDRISEAMNNAQMFIKKIESGDSAPSEIEPFSERSDKTAPTPLPTTTQEQSESTISWVIVAGHYDNPQTAREIFEVIKRKGVSSCFLISNKAEQEYTVVIWSYNGKDETFLEQLKQKGIVHRDATWSPLKISEMPKNGRKE